MHEQEKMEWMRKMEVLQYKERVMETKKLQLQLKLKDDLENNKTRITEFQKKFAIDKAAEVIYTFEKLAIDDKKINMRKLRKQVLNNLV